MEQYLDWTTQMTVMVARSAIRIALIVIITIFLLRLIRTLSKKLAGIMSQQELDIESEKRAETLGLVIRHTLDVLLIAVAVITILGELGIAIGPILAAAGIVGVAVGFGSQSLIKDVINGFFILANDQIRVGDSVQVAGKSGDVEQVTLKMTVLRDISGNVHFIPNSAIDIVTNMTKEFSRQVFDIGLTYQQDVDRAIEVIRKVGESLQQDPAYAMDILAPLEVMGVERFAESSVIIRVRITVKPGRQAVIGRAFNHRLKRMFDENQIEFPLPSRTVYNVRGEE